MDTPRTFDRLTDRHCQRLVVVGVVVLGLGWTSAPTHAQERPCPPVEQGELRDTIAQVQRCLASLEEQLARVSTPAPAVDLSEREHPAFTADEPTAQPGRTAGADDTDDDTQGVDQSIAGASVASQPWYRTISLSGFGAVEYIDSGASGSKPFGGFGIRESSLFLEAKAWDDVALFLEIQVNRLGKDKELFVRTGEAHVLWRNVLERWGEDLLHLKAGRVDIPFGEDYLWQDAIDNPLISFAAAYPYGFDEGIVLFGTMRGVGWIAAVTDGTDDRSVEENRDKARQSESCMDGRCRAFYVSASAMRTGRTSESALEFGGQPSRTGRHRSDVDARQEPEPRGGRGAGPSRRHRQPSRRGATLAVSAGTARLDDADDAFDRAITWFSVEPRYPSAAGRRTSSPGTAKSAPTTTSRGYHFDGKTTAGGHAAYGYDVRRLQRLSVGVGYRPNPRMLLKAEVGRDWFHPIRRLDQRAPNGDDRLLLGRRVWWSDSDDGLPCEGGRAGLALACPRRTGGSRGHSARHSGRGPASRHASQPDAGVGPDVRRHGTRPGGPGHAATCQRIVPRSVGSSGREGVWRGANGARGQRSTGEGHAPPEGDS